MFAERLRALRQGKRLSQQALGAMVGVSATAVYKWERGQAEPDLKTTRLLADIFGVTVDELVRPGGRVDPNLSVMTRAIRRMTPEEQAQFLQLGRALFAHAFGTEDQP